MLGYRDAINVSEFQQVRVDNRETETNSNNEKPILDEEWEYQEISEGLRIMSKLLFYFVSRFTYVNLSLCVSFFNPFFITHRGAFPLSFWKIILFSNIRCDPDATEMYTSCCYFKYLKTAISLLSSKRLSQFS